MLALPHHRQSMQQVLTRLLGRGYAHLVTANSVADLGRSNYPRRTSAAPVLGAFFVPATRNGGCAWDTFGCAGSLGCRSANPRTVAPIRCLAAAGDDSTIQGVTPMAISRLFPTRNPSARAAAHRAMARAALFADSSAAVRIKRYNYHAQKARDLDALAVGQEVLS